MKSIKEAWRDGTISTITFFILLSALLIGVALLERHIAYRRMVNAAHEAIEETRQP
jgi:hypothetical protein